jgi:hypothetical protein
MATSGSCTDPYSGRTSFNGYLVVSRHSVSGTSARWAWTLYARNPNGSSSTYNLGSNPWTVNVEGQVFSGAHDLDFRGGQASIVLGSGVTGWISQGTGTRVINFSFSHGPAGVFGTAAGSGSFTANALVSLPGAPPAPVFRSATATSLSFTIFQPTSNGGSPVLDYTMAIYLPTSMGGALVESWVGTGSQQTSPETLNPGIAYRVQYRARNAVGLGGWSPLVNMSTLSVVAPTIGVTPAANGGSATVAVTPPETLPEPDAYRIEYRVAGAATATTRDVTTVPTVITGLTPGQTYEWRAAVLSGTYVSPFTAWTPVLQPAPNTNPGDYFDGSTAAKTDTTYAWTGTANNSTSQATSSRPLGWATFAQGAETSGGAGVVMRSTGGRSGGFAARVVFTADTVNAGFHAGLSASAPGVAVTEVGVEHNALIHAQLPARSQRLAAMLLWVNGSGVEVGRTVGPDQVVGASGVTWTPLRVSGTTPAGAVGVAVRVIDVAGSGWSPWTGGDLLLLDDAITPFNESYFDGATVDTAQFEYNWEGVANQSPSYRTTNDIEPVDPLLDPDCPPVPAPPRPPFIDDSCLEEVVTEWRRLYVNLEKVDYWDTPVWAELVPTLSITATQDVRQVRIRYFQNPFGRGLDDLDADEFCAEQIITFIPGGAILTIDGVTRRVRAEVAGSATSLTADKLLATQAGDVEQWVALSCGMPYFLTVDVPVDLPANAISVGYELTARYS